MDKIYELMIKFVPSYSMDLLKKLNDDLHKQQSKIPDHYDKNLVEIVTVSLRLSIIVTFFINAIEEALNLIGDKELFKEDRKRYEEMIEAIIDISNRYKQGKFFEINEEGM